MSMKFSLGKSLEIIENTPAVISVLLNNLSDDWTMANEGPNTWSVKEIVAHLIVCEETDWLPRAKIILSNTPHKTFVPIDMLGHYKLAENYSLAHLITRFQELRKISLTELKSLNINEEDHLITGSHPVIGEVNLKQLISTWVAHDLAHLSQILRVMAKQYKEKVGPFKELFTILN